MGDHGSGQLSKFGDAFSLTRAEISLDRYWKNTAAMKQHIGPKVELMAVVKADGYGHGAIAIGKTALKAGADHLAVYTPAEALYLRKAGVDGSLMVLGPIRPSIADLLVRHEITPNISTLDLARAFSSAAAAHGQEVGYHVELDTGLTRYGLLPAEAMPFLTEVDGLPGLRREGLFTHFARADEQSKVSVWDQFNLFMKMRQKLEGHGIRFRVYHAAASAAALEFPEMHLDLVRVGLALYGYYPSSHVARTVELLPVMVLGSHLARVRSVPRGTGVSYGHDWKAKHRSVIGLVPFGYADGMPRTIQGKGQVLVRGKRAPVVGRVAMDQFMVDLSHIEDAHEGDPVILIGGCGDDEITADDLGDWAGTISYEVLSRVSTRVPRLYIAKGRPAWRRSGMTMNIESVEPSAT